MLKDFLPNLIFQRELKNASNSNPVKELLKTSPYKSDPQANATAIFIAIVSLIGLASAVAAFYYVSTRATVLTSSDKEASGIVVASSNIVAPVNYHIVCTNTISVTLPDPTSLDSGSYVSMSVPMPLSSPTSDGRTATVYWTNSSESGKSYIIQANQGVLFMVSRELSTKKWKISRTW